MTTNILWNKVEGLKQAKLFNNCIEYPFLTYQYHRFVETSKGIFQKPFTLFEEAYHQLDLKLGMHWKENSINSSEYEAFSSMLRNHSAAKCEIDSLMQEEEMIQQVATYHSIVNGSNELLATGLLELSSTCHTQVEVLVSEIRSYSHS